MNKTVYTTMQAEGLCDLYKVIPAAYVERHPNLISVGDQVKHGIIFVDENCHAVAVDRNTWRIANDLYDVDPEAMNATFYKSFQTVLDKDRFDLFVDQIIHYLFTYGREAMGLHPITVIPMQDIVVPEVDVSKLKVTVIQLVGDKEVQDLVNLSLRTVKAPSKRIVKHMESLIPLSALPLEDIKSFELMIMACDYAGVVPENAKLWLRYVIYKLTGETLIIKNRKLVNAIKDAAGEKDDLCKQLLERANPVYLSRIFLRYKPLFLAMKHHDGCAPYINKLRRMADTYHQPLTEVTVQNYIPLALAGDRTALAVLRKRMDNRELVKVINALLVRLNSKDGDPAVYNIRNGRAFCKDEAYKEFNRKERQAINLEITNLYDELTRRLRATVEGKTFYIPEEVRYAVPQSEKQYVGNMPWGTVIVPDLDNVLRPMTVGIQWYNTPDYRVDLDLHAFSKTTHFGWNGAYNQEGATVIYSGDMTNAPMPHGAAEAFWIDGYMEPVIFTVNEYHGPAEMKFKLFFASDRIDKTPKGWDEARRAPYCMNPDDLIVPPIPLYINGDRTHTIGFYHKGEFFIYGGNLSEGIVPSANYSQYLDAVIAQQKMHITLAELLEHAGAHIVRNRGDSDALEAEGTEVIDLSPEALTATTLLEIVDGK